MSGRYPDRDKEEQVNKQATLARVTKTGTAFDGATVEVIGASDTEGHLLVNLIGYDTELSVAETNLERI
jgi:hypothetical protein